MRAAVVAARLTAARLALAVLAVAALVALALATEQTVRQIWAAVLAVLVQMHRRAEPVARAVVVSSSFGINSNDKERGKWLKTNLNHALTRAESLASQLRWRRSARKAGSQKY
jgi:hypothetical protein